MEEEEGKFVEGEEGEGKVFEEGEGRRQRRGKQWRRKRERGRGKEDPEKAPGAWSCSIAVGHLFCTQLTWDGPGLFDSLASHRVP